MENTTAVRPAFKHMRSSTSSSGSPFLDLPPEIRNQIYEEVALDSEAHLPTNSPGKLINHHNSLNFVSRGLHSEYEDVLYTSTALITTLVQDFDFSHILALFDRLAEPKQKALQDSRPQLRHLKITLKLTAACRRNLDALRAWLDRISSQDPIVFTTTYTIHPDSVGPPKPVGPNRGAALEAGFRAATIAPITVMRVLDVVYVDWCCQSPPGPFKTETQKIVECLGQLEDQVSRARGQPGPGDSGSSRGISMESRLFS